MTPEQKQAYTDDLVAGVLPDQENYTKEEMRYIAISLLQWAALQIDHEIEESHIDDIKDYVAATDFKSIEEALTDFQDGSEEAYRGLRDFISDWIE